jgi:molybdate transport system permease protein
LHSARAWLLAHGRFAGRALLNTLVHAPLVLPPVVVGYALLLLFGVQGVLGHWLDATFASGWCSRPRAHRLPRA